MEKLRLVLKSNELIYDLVKKSKLEGMTELELRALMVKEYGRILDKFTFTADVVAGENSSYIEGYGSDYVIKRGDAVILDLQPYKDKRCCDTTRTFFIGEPSKLQREVYEIVKNTLLGVERLLKPGLTPKEIFEETKRRLAPYEDTFVHHAGHLIKSRRVCQPQFLPEKKGALKKGDIVALEPAIYIKDSFGVRLENNYLITDKGYERLFDYPLDIENFITE